MSSIAAISLCQECTNAKSLSSVRLTVKRGFWTLFLTSTQYSALGFHLQFLKSGARTSGDSCLDSLAKAKM